MNETKWDWVTDMASLYIYSNGNIQSILDAHYTVRCPRCGVLSGISAVSVPIYNQIARFQLQSVGVVFKCDACKQPIFAEYRISASYMDGTISLIEPCNFVETAVEPYDYRYLPASVAEDFAEALQSYSYKLYNSFAAMCRRTVQSIALDLGVEGTNRVKDQLRDLRSMNQIDQETFEYLSQIIVDGADGAHPHLPTITAERARVLLALVKEVLHGIYVKRALLREATNLRIASVETRRRKPKSAIVGEDK